MVSDSFGSFIKWWWLCHIQTTWCETTVLQIWLVLKVVGGYPLMRLQFAVFFLLDRLPRNWWAAEISILHTFGVIDVWPEGLNDFVNIMSFLVSAEANLKQQLVVLPRYWFSISVPPKHWGRVPSVGERTDMINMKGAFFFSQLLENMAEAIRYPHWISCFRIAVGYGFRPLNWQHKLKWICMAHVVLKNLRQPSFMCWSATVCQGQCHWYVGSAHNASELLPVTPPGHGCPTRLSRGGSLDTPSVNILATFQSLVSHFHWWFHVVLRSNDWVNRAWNCRGVAGFEAEVPLGFLHLRGCWRWGRICGDRFPQLLESGETRKTKHMKRKEWTFEWFCWRLCLQSLQSICGCSPGNKPKRIIGS